MARAEENHLDPLYLHFSGLGHGTHLWMGWRLHSQCDTAALSWGQLVMVPTLPGACQ